MEEKLFFENSNGLKIRGILLEPNENKKEVVILVHGYSSHKNGSSSKQMSQELEKRDINSFRIDLNGCGESDGNFSDHTISSAADDVSCAIELMKKRRYEKISLFGSSASGITVMAAALKYPEIKRIGLKAPVSDYPTQKMRKMGKEGIEKWKKEGFNYYSSRDKGKIKIKYSFYEDAKKHVMYDQAKSIKCPVLIIHGDADFTVLLEQSQKVVEKFPDAKLIVLKGADHGLGINGDRTLANKLFGDWFEFGHVEEK
jgi:hypothetical protein